MRGFWSFLKRGLAFRWKPKHVAPTLQVQSLEDRITPVAFTPRLETLRSFFAFEQAFSHGVSVASGDMNSDGVPDILAGSGAGAPTRIALIDGKTSQPIRTFLPFDGFTGGATVATGDFNNDGVPDIVAGAGPGGSPRVSVFDGKSGALLKSFYAFDQFFTGGVSVSVADVTGDGMADIITAAGPGGGPHVKVFDGRTGALANSFFAYAKDFTGGVSVAVGDVNGDGRVDIVTGAGPGGGPHVKAFDGRTGTVLRSFFAYDTGFTGGVNVAVGNATGVANILTGAGPGGGPHVKVFDAQTTELSRSFFAYANQFSGGVKVSTGDFNIDGLADVITGVGPGGGPHVKVFQLTSTDTPQVPGIPPTLPPTLPPTSPPTVPPPLPPNFDLTGWTSNILGGSDPGRGSISVTDGVLTLKEGNSFRVALSKAFTLPNTPTAIRISYEAPSFDTSSQNNIKDAFEVAVLGDDGSPLALTVGKDRDAAFNWTEQLDPITADGTTTNGTTTRTLTVNLSALPAATAAKLVLRLVNNDTDTGTAVRISRVDFVAATTSAPVGSTPPTERLKAATTPDVSSLADVTPSAIIDYGRTTLTDENTILTTDVSLRNTGTYALAGRVVAVVGNVSDPSVRVLDPDGYTASGQPYFDFTPEMNGTVLKPGLSSAARTLRFANPNRERFTYDVQVLAGLDQNPVFTTAPITMIQAGRAYQYPARATDPNGQGITYRLLSGPAGMTVNPTTGDVAWSTAANDISNQTVRLQATDPNGGSAIQSFTLSVRADIANRPPIITSTPNTDATVAGAWEVNTQPLGTSAPAIDSKTQTLNFNGTSMRVGEQAPSGRMFQTGHEVDIGLPTTARSADFQNIPSVAQADLNGDGTLDVITSAASSVDLGYTRGYDVQNFVSIAFNKGDGSFAAPTKLLIESSGDRALNDFTARNLTVADFDGDGKADILALYGKLGYYGDANGPYQLLFWKGQGNGTFAALQKTTLASPLQWIQAADMTGDGKLDLVAADNRYGSTLGVLKGNGDGTFGAFTATATYSGAAYASIPALVDVDGKNGLDVVLTSYSPARVDVYVNDGSGNLSKSTSFPVTSQLGDGGLSITAGDFNGDSKADVAVTTSNSFGVWTGAGDGVGFTLNNSNNQLGFLFNSASATATDLNGDGKLDLLYGRVKSGTDQRGLFVALGQGDGSFTFDRYALGNDTADSDYTNSQLEIAVLAGDYNRDGVMDLAVGTTGSTGSRNRVTVIDGLTPGNFASPKQVATAPGLSTVLVGDVNNDGTPDMVYFNAGQNLYSGTFLTKLGNGDGTFAAPQAALAASGYSPISAYLLDINKDGKLDLVFSLLGQSGTVYGINQVALGNGDGTFTTSFSTYQGNYFYGNSLFTGDFNNDGYPDLMAFVGAINAPGTGTFVDGFYDIYLNDGGSKGTFTLSSHRVIPVGSGQDNSPKSVAIADFDGDGKLDVVNFIQKTGSTPFQLLLLKGTGDGKLADPVSTDVLTTNTDSVTISWTAAGDMNGDGKADIVAFGAYGQLSIFLGNGDGTFTTPVQYPSGSYPTNAEQFKLLDFNGDGKLDVVKIDTGPYLNKEGISVRLGNGDGTLQAPQVFTTFGNISNLSVGDLDGDGLQDVLATTSFQSGQATAYLGTKPGLAGVTTGDVNGDGKADLLAANTANDRVKVLMGNGNNTFNRQVDVIVGRGPVALATADFNSDGKLDIVTANRTGKSITVLRGDGLGGFTRSDISVGVKPVSLAVGDLTGDGKPDILVADDGSNAAYLLINTGTGFAAPVAIPLGDKPGKVTLADITGDGKLDAVFTLPDSKRLMMLPGMSNGTFGLPVYVNLPATPGAITSGDFNQDGKIDLAVTFPTEGTAAVLYSRGSGLFAKPQVIRVGANPTAIIAQDTSGDGRLDLIVTNSGDNTTSVILNKYDATKLYRYTVTATDPDGDPLTFELADGPGGMILNPSTGEIVWAPTGDQLGSNPITIKVSDGQGGSATQTFSIAVAPSNTNAKPVFTSTPKAVVQSTEAFTYTPKAIDTDGTTLRYRLVNGPAGASIDPLTGKVSWDGRSGAFTFNQRPFDNSGSSGVSIPDRPELQPASLTAEGWFRFDDPTKNQELLGKLRRLFYNDTYSFNLSYLYGNLYARVSGSDSQGYFVTKDATFTWSPVVGQWYHLAMTFDDATGAIGLLINGKLVASANANFHLGYTSGSGSDLNIGKLYGSGFVGSATNIRLWNAARTPQQIQADLVRQVPANALNLLLDLPFNDDDSQTIRDASINHFDGRRTTESGPWPTSTTGLAQEQTQNFTIRVEDGRGGFDEQTFSVQVVAPFRSSIRGNVGRSDNGLSLAGWSVRVNGQRVLTDAAGNYSLDNLLAGTYVVALEAPAGWTVGSPASGSYTVTLGESETANGKDFRIAPVNASQVTGPKFLPMTPISVQARSLFRTSVLALDPASRPITYSLSLAPAGMAIDPANGFIAWTPTIKDVGSARILVKAMNDQGAVDLLEFTLSVTAPNTAPVISTSPPTTAFSGVAFRYDVRAQDAEQSTLTYSLTTAPSGATINADTGRISWTPTAVQLGVQQLNVTVSDGAGGTTQQSFTLNVLPASANTAPTILTLPRGTAKAGLAYRGKLTAGDAEQDVLSFSLNSGPSGLTISDDGLIAWTPTASQVGDNAVSVTVNDGRGGSDTRTFNIRVGSGLANSAPVFTTKPPTFAKILRPFALDLQATDADGDPVVFELLTGPGGMSLDPVRGSLRWTPAADQLGSTTIRVRVFDPFGGEASLSFPLIVRGESGPPAITSTPTSEAAVGQAFLYSVIAVDAENDPLTYSLLQAPAGMNINAITGELNWTPSESQVGQQAVIIEVRDGFGGSTTQGFAIKTLAGVPNRPPIISTDPPLVASAGSPYSFTLNATDPEGSAIRYELRRGPIGMIVDATTGVVTWTPDSTQLGTTVVTLVALDSGNAAGVLSFELTTLAANRAPTITSTAPQSTTAGSTFRYDVKAADADLEPLAFTLVSAPTGMTVDAFGRIRWTTKPSDIGVSAATVRVADPRGGSIEQTFTFSVKADTTAPNVVVIPGAKTVAANSPEVFAKYNIPPFYPTNTVRIAATDDVGVSKLTATANGKAITLDAQGNSVFHFEDWGFGTVRIVATATDAAGNEGKGSGGFVFKPFGDDPAITSVAHPEAVITSPTSGENTGGLVNIQGTATSDTFTNYALFYRRVDQSNYTQIATGTSKVNAGVLGKWDTSLLENDEYVLRLEVNDEIVGATIYEQNVGVSGNLKLGNFRLSFADMTIPVAGIPITLARTYDTLRADRTGDVGYGWRLEYRNTNLQTGLPKTGLEDIGQFAAFKPGTKVFLTLPGGERQGFTFTPDLRALPSFGGDPLIVATPRFTADRGVTSTLSVRGGTYLLNAVNQITTLGGQNYNPAAEDFGGGYTLTTKDGTQFFIDGVTGLMKTAKDRNDNTLTFSDSGVSSSSGPAISFLRDAKGRIVGVVDPAGKTVFYSYDAKGDLVRVTDRMGNITQFTYRTDRPHYLDSVIDPLGRTGVKSVYGADGRLSGTLDANGHGPTVAYDPDNSLITTTDALGNKTISEYDSRGNVVAQTDALGGTTRTTYDANNNVTSATNQLGHTTTFEYNANGDMTAQIDALGNTSFVGFNTNGVAETLTSATGRTVRNTFDNQGRLHSYRSASGAETIWSLDNNGQVLQTRDANGGTMSSTYANGYQATLTDVTGTTAFYVRDGSGLLLQERRTYTGSGGVVEAKWNYTYDANGDMLGVTGPDGKTTSRTIDAAGQYTSTTSASGVTTNFEYNLTGNISQVIDSTGQRTSYEYDPLGRVTSVTLPGGITRRTKYDALGRIVEQTNSSGEPVFFSYDAAGQRIRVSDAQGNASLSEYNAVGQLTATVDRRGGTTRNVYDKDGLLTTTTDPQGLVTKYVYGTDGQLTSTILPDGRVVEAKQNAGGQTTKLTDPLLGDWAYTYAATGTLASATDPQGRVTRYTSDSNGNVDGVTDSLGRSHLFRHDPQGRLTGWSLPTGEALSYTYDAEGRLASVTDATGRIVGMEYNSRGQLLRRSENGVTFESFTYDITDGRMAQAVTNSGTTTFGVDRVLRTTHLSEPGGVDITVGYDAAGRPTSLNSAGRTTQIERDGAGLITGMVTPSGTHTVFTRDAAGKIIVTTTDTLAVTQTYDSGDRLVSTSAGSGTWTIQRNSQFRIVRETGPTGREVRYTYDAAGRLASEAVSGASLGNGLIRYSYDEVGNLVKVVDANGATRLIAHDASDHITQDGGSQVGYDFRGNLVTRRSATVTESYTYDASNRLIRFERTGSNATVVIYGYTYDGLLLSRIENGNKLVFVWDRVNSTLPQLAEIIDGQGLPIARYTHNGAFLTTVETQGTVYRYVLDGRGSLRGTLSDAGLQQYEYDALGNRLGTAAPGGIGFANGWTDAATGFVFLRARWYDPHTAGFTQLDSAPPDISRPDSLNRYTYAGGDPINRIDPTGLFTITEQTVNNFLIGTLATSFIGIVGFSGSLIVSSGILKNASQYDLFNPQRITAYQATFGVGGAAGYGPFGVGIGGAVDLLYFPALSTVAWYDSLGANASISNSTGKSAGVTGNIGVGVIFDARDPGDYTGFSWSVSGSVGLRNIQQLAKSELDLSKLVVGDSFYRDLHFPGFGPLYSGAPSLTGASSSTTLGSSGIGVSISFSSSPYDLPDGRQRLTHGATLIPYSVGFGPGMSKSASFSLGFAYYWLAETWS